MARRGICSSPLSSADEAEEDVGAPSSFPAMSPSPPASKPAKSRATGAKRKPSRAKKTLLPPAKKPKPSAATERKSTKELVHDASQEFVEYLAEQLSAMQQAKFETEFGGGQGYIVKLPSSSWKTKRKRDELQAWIKALGFTSGASLNRHALRVASLKADVILSELKQRLPSIAEYVRGGRAELPAFGGGYMLIIVLVLLCIRRGEDKEEEVEGEDDEAADGGDEEEKDQTGDYLTDPAMLRLKNTFKSWSRRHWRSCRTRKTTDCCPQRSTWRSPTRWKTCWHNLRFEENVVWQDGFRSWDGYRAGDSLQLLWDLRLLLFSHQRKTTGCGIAR